MIHPTALVDPKAELADDVEVGAFTIIDGKVRIDWSSPGRARTPAFKG